MNRIFYLFVEAIYYLQEKFPDTNIIIRPHPSENSSTYENAFIRHDRVHVEDSGDVRAWIAGAGVIIHHTSTTGIESALMGVPAISYRPIQNEDYESKLPRIASEEAFNREQLVKYVTQYHKQEQSYELDAEQAAYLNQYFSNIDSSAAEIMCDVVEALEISSKKQYWKLRPEFSGRIERRVKACRWSTQVIAAYDMFQRLTGNKVARDRRRYTRQKFPELEEYEITERIEQLKSALELGPVSVENVPLTNDTFVLQRS